MVAFPKHRLFDNGRQRPQALSLNASFTFAEDEIVGETRRAVSMVCVGELTPASAAADLLDCAALWVEGAQGRSMNISWAGEGDMRGLLAAQPLPAALLQTFIGGLFRVDPAAALASADLVCVLQNVDPVQSLMDALQTQDGVAIVARSCKPVARQLRGRQNVWLFDERRPATLMAGLERALGRIFARRLQRNPAITDHCVV